MENPSVRGNATVHNTGYEVGEVVRNQSAGELVLSSFRRIKWMKSDQ